MTKQPLTILIDQDGVLVNYHARLLEIWRAEHPEKIWVPEEELREHDIDKNYPEAYRDILEEIVLRKGFYRSLAPIPGGKEALEHLLMLGHNVRICTAPKRNYRNCVNEKYDSIAEHFGQQWVERMIVTRDKTLVHGHILIDDKPLIAGSQTPQWEHILYDQPYNRGYHNRRLTWKNYREVLGV